MASKQICITGASSGIGAATAKVLAKQGHRLILGARRLDRLEALKPQLLDLGASKVDFFELDVQKAESIATFCQQVCECSQNNLDVLINNAGLALATTKIVDGDSADWQTMLDTNVMGVLQISQKLLPMMIQNRSGHILFTSSIAAHQVYEGGGAYCASKFAVRAIAKTLKLELSGTNIRVGTVDPGMVDTEFSLVRHRGDQQKADKTYDGLTPLSPEDIADCLAFMISRPAHFNIDEMILMPTDQATVYKVNRR